MAKFFLTIAIFAVTVQVLVPTLLDLFARDQIPYLYCAAYAPVVILGVRSWCRSLSFARSWPVVMCLMVAWLGALRTFGEHGQASFYDEMRTVMLVTVVLPVAALITEHRCWWYCALVFVLGCAVILGVLVWIEYGMKTDLEMSCLHRLGLIRSRDRGARLMDPNQLGAQFALGAVLALVLHLRGAARPLSLPPGQAPPRPFSLVWTLLLSLGCFLTASRTAFVSWLAGMGVVFVFGTRNQSPSKVRDLVVQVGLLLAVAAVFTSIGSSTPWQDIYERFTVVDTGELVTLGGRVSIWRSVLQVWQSNYTFMFLGTGVARAEDILGRNNDLAVVDSSGVARLDTHNTFLKWLLSFGLIGAIPLVCLAAVASQRAHSLDAWEGTANRQAVLATTLLLSMSGVLYERFYWLALGPLLLAMLSSESWGFHFVERGPLRTPGGRETSHALAEQGANPEPGVQAA